jgi:hypothetical protein
MCNPQYPHGPQGHPLEVLHDIHRRAELVNASAGFGSPSRIASPAPQLRPALLQWLEELNGAVEAPVRPRLGTSNGHSTAGPFPVWNCPVCGQRNRMALKNCLCCKRLRDAKPPFTARHDDGLDEQATAPRLHANGPLRDSDSPSAPRKNDGRSPQVAVTKLFPSDFLERPRVVRRPTQ